MYCPNDNGHSSLECFELTIYEGIGISGCPCGYLKEKRIVDRIELNCILIH